MAMAIKEIGFVILCFIAELKYCCNNYFKT